MDLSFGTFNSFDKQINNAEKELADFEIEVNKAIAELENHQLLRAPL